MTEGERNAIPGWFSVAGAALGALTLFFLMLLVVLSLLGRSVPCDQRFLVVVVLALGAGLSSSFLGGTAAAQGSIPLPFAKTHPLQISAAGGFAVLVIVLVLGSSLFDESACKEPIPIAGCEGESRFTIMRTNFTEELLDGATREADALLVDYPDCAEAWNVKGGVAFYRRQFELAASFFSKALQLSPNERRFLDNLSYAFVELGRYEEAIGLLERIPSEKPDWSYAIGRAHFYAGNFEASRQHLRTVPTHVLNGAARVLEAACLLSQAEASADPRIAADLREAASAQLREGVSEKPRYWRDVFENPHADIHQGFTKPVQVLRAIAAPLLE